MRIRIRKRELHKNQKPNEYCTHISKKKEDKCYLVPNGECESTEEKIKTIDVTLFIIFCNSVPF